MANGFRVGTFTKSTNTSVPNDQAVTGVGFQPKVLLLFLLPQTATGNSSDQAFGMGMCGSAADVQASAQWSDDAVSTTAAVFRAETKAIASAASSGGTTVCLADLKSFDSDGFTLTWTRNDSSLAYEIFYIAIGGNDITNVKLHKPTAQSGTGNKDYTGVGFQPDIIFFFYPAGSGAGSLSANGANLNFGWGAAISSSKRWAQAICVQS